MFAESLRWDVPVRRHIASLIKQKGEIGSLFDFNWQPITTLIFDYKLLLFCTAAAKKTHNLSSTTIVLEG